MSNKLTKSKISPFDDKFIRKLFALDHIEQGYTVSLLRNGKLRAEKKTETGILLRFELSKNPLNFLDGQPEEYEVIVFENGVQMPVSFKLSEFYFHYQKQCV